jgi:Tol biopolymer transport system component/DNA-binding winged helix-turn-helix (wHTH) protein
MPPEAPSPAQVRFGVFEADLASGELRKHGRKVKLQRQPFQVLALLIQQPGTLITREELQRAVWPDEAYGDFDQGVNTAIRKLRQALGDSADNPRFIETLPRKGYRFIAPITRAETEAVSRSTTAGTALKRKASGRLIGATAAALSGVAAVYFSITYLRNGPVRLPEVTPLTTYRGIEREPAFSPDGKYVAFCWNGDDEANFDIYVKPLDSDRATRLTHDALPDFGPAWAPDGQMIVFGRRLDESRIAVYVVPAAGGSEAKLLEQPHRRTEQPYSPFVSWSPDGKWLAISDVADIGAVGDSARRLFLLSVETGERRPLTKDAPNSSGDFAPALSADGRFLAFFRQVARMGRTIQILRLNADLTPAGEPRQLSPQDSRALSLAWIRGTKELLLSVVGEYGNTTEFKILDATSGKVRGTAFQTRYSESVAASRDGRAAYSQIVADKNIWKLEVDEGGNAIGDPRPYLASTRDDQNPKYSRDGKQLVFTSNRSGTLEVWTCRSDATNPRQLTTMGEGTTGAPRWSPDGSRIVFDSNKGGQFELYSILAAGGAPQRLTNMPGGNGLGSFSRDGRTIYFVSGRSGNLEIWKMPAAGGAPVQITKRGGRFAIESADAAFLYYSKEGSAEERAGNGGIWRVPVDGGEEVRIVPTVTFQNFAIADDTLYYIPQPDSSGVYSIYRVRLDAAVAARRLVDIAGQPAPGMTVSPDGRTLLWSQTDAGGSDLMLVGRVE